MQIIDYIKNQGVLEFLKTQPIQKIYLFGSHARDEATRESDLDFLVDLEEKVDLISSNGISPRISPYIEREKVLIYEKQNQ